MTISQKRIERAARNAWIVRHPDAPWDSPAGPSIPEKRWYFAEAESCLRADAPEIDAYIKRADNCKMQAQFWAMEAKGARSSLLDAYQAASGATGERGDWNGALPICEALQSLKASIASAHAAGKAEGLQEARDAVESCASYKARVVYLKAIDARLAVIRGEGKRKLP